MSSYIRDGYIKRTIHQLLTGEKIFAPLSAKFMLDAESGIIVFFDKERFELRKREPDETIVSKWIEVGSKHYLRPIYAHA